jgi:ribA/ribD-fused uncharacterized protein
MIEPIKFFKDDYEKYSNFYQVRITYEDFIFDSVEIAFVAAKTKDRYIRFILSKLKASDSGKAKRTGRKLKLRENWEIIKIPIMGKLIDQKFNYPKFRDKLLLSGSAELIEGNHWHDNFWGDCYCEKCKNIPGQNQLGKLLMKKRSTL